MISALIILFARDHPGPNGSRGRFEFTLALGATTVFRLSKVTDYGIRILAHLARDEADFEFLSEIAQQLDSKPETVNGWLKVSKKKGGK